MRFVAPQDRLVSRVVQGRLERQADPVDLCVDDPADLASLGVADRQAHEGRRVELAVRGELERRVRQGHAAREASSGLPGLLAASGLLDPYPA